MERRAIGRELHDQFGQMLTAIKITLEVAGQLPAEAAAKKIAQAQELATDLLGRVSRLSLELRPTMLDDLGLIAALIWHINRYQEQTGINVGFKHSGVEGERFSTAIETTAYRIVQEALTNVVRHAHAASVQITIGNDTGWLEIRIDDDGVGFDPQTALAKNRGLAGMRERAQLVGGVFHIESESGRGTHKVIRLPLYESVP
jgi:signal transduction histidine kinase